MIMIMMHRVLLVLVVGASAFVPMIMATKVLVTGAGGKTGSLVFKKLLQRPEYEPVGLVRTEKVSDR
jgi:FlaA1/EpsC-like NDP-sugar epimerase